MWYVVWVVNYIHGSAWGVWCITPLEDVVADIHLPLLSCAGFTGGLLSTLPSHWGWGMDDAQPDFVIYHLLLSDKYPSVDYTWKG